jgi:uncharacterized caspase-like protein
VVFADLGTLMKYRARIALTWLMVVVAMALAQHGARAAEQRFALVIGNDEYRTAKLATPANDAGLVADALQAAGFTVTGARNLDQATLRATFREFLGQVSAAGPDAVALVYFAGFGLQFEGDNYFVPVDADIQRDVDVPLQAIRISDFIQPLAALPGRVKIVILDAARQNPFARNGQPLAGGLALVDPIPSVAIAFNAAPGTVGPDEQGPYGAYASALTETIAAGGLDLDEQFARLRLRVSELTQGAEVPWSVSQIDGPFMMTERTAEAPAPVLAAVPNIGNQPIRDFSNVDDAYAAAIDRDTIEGYEQFLAAYPSSPYAARVAAMVAVRREQIVWRRAVTANTPPAYWSYLRRYPSGPHTWDARRRLGMLSAAYEPPPDFAVFDFGVPPPPPAELDFIDQPVVIFAGPRFAPPPPPPPRFLPPRPPEFAHLPPPPPPGERFGLPVPTAAVIPAFVRPPASVTVRPAAPAAPGARPATRVSLPEAVQGHGAPSPAGPVAHPVPGAAPGAPPPLRPGAAGPPPVPPPPSSAAVKPNRLPPPPGPAPATVKPAAPPPPPPPERTPATIKPAAPPPVPPAAPATVKPAAPPPPAPPARTPATIKPAAPPPPPPHPAAPPRPPAPAAVTAHPVPAAPHPGPPAKPVPCPPGKKPTPEGCK